MYPAVQCGGPWVPDYGETMDWDTGGSGDEKMAKVAEARMSLVDEDRI